MIELHQQLSSVRGTEGIVQGRPEVSSANHLILNSLVMAEHSFCEVCGEFLGMPSGSNFGVFE